MYPFKQIHIPYESYGLKYHDGKFTDLLEAGRYWIFDPLGRYVIARAWTGKPWIELPESQLRQIRESDKVNQVAEFIDLKDTERALIWFDGRFGGILGPGLYGYWTTRVKVNVEIVNINQPRFAHAQAEVILNHADASKYLNLHDVADGKKGVVFINGKFEEILEPGRYAYWKNVGHVRLYQYELREKVLDVSGQEIMTSDKVTLRLNALLSYKITDVRKVAESIDDYSQALYRETQLVLRAEVGTRNLDQLLNDKVAVAQNALDATKAKAKEYGIEILGLGIRDIILPGDMKELLNQVIEAQKAAEANVIKRREETAALRSQLNSAKLLDQTPTLMRLRELETLERVAEKANLQILVGSEKGLAESVTKLI